MNWKNRTIFTGDNLEILRGLNTASVDMVYLDPPFNSKKEWNAPIGSRAAEAHFKDTWTLADVDDLWHQHLRSENPGLHDVVLASKASGGNGTMSYLLYMAVRLQEMARVLKPTGSIFLHCDPTESHSLKLMMDTIFGRDLFINEITWKRADGRSKGSQFEPRSFGNDYDIILAYGRSSDYLFHRPYAPLSEQEMVSKFPHQDSRGRYHTTTPLFRGPGMGARPNLCYEYKGVVPDHSAGWRMSKERLMELDSKGEIIWRSGKKPLRKTYADSYKGKPVGNLWTDIPMVAGQERTGYPTQKPVALLDRIIQASTNEQDIVLDPFCGCATTAISAEGLQRQWIGIDLSEVAVRLVKDRLVNELGLMGSLAKEWNTATEGLPRRNDQGRLPHYTSHKKTLYGEQEGHCNGCGTHFTIGNFHCDHIVPKAKGGTDHKSNIQLLCGSCNSKKGKGSMSDLMARLLKERGIQ